MRLSLRASSTSKLFASWPRPCCRHAASSMLAAQGGCFWWVLRQRAAAIAGAALHSWRRNPAMTARCAAKWGGGLIRKTGKPCFHHSRPNRRAGGGGPHHQIGTSDVSLRLPQRRIFVLPPTLVLAHSLFVWPRLSMLCPKASLVRGRSHTPVVKQPKRAMALHTAERAAWGRLVCNCRIIPAV